MRGGEELHDSLRQIRAHAIREHPLAVVYELDVRQVVLAAVLLQRHVQLAIVVDAIFPLRRGGFSIARIPQPTLSDVPIQFLLQDVVHQVGSRQRHLDEDGLHPDLGLGRVGQGGEPGEYPPPSLLAAPRPILVKRAHGVRGEHDGDSSGVDVLGVSIHRVDAVNARSPRGRGGHDVIHLHRTRLCRLIVVGSLQKVPQAIEKVQGVRVGVHRGRHRLVSPVRGGRELGDIERLALGAVEESQVPLQPERDGALPHERQTDEDEDVPLADVARERGDGRGHGRRRRVYRRGGQQILLRFRVQRLAVYAAAHRVCGGRRNLVS
mmetsp:Transcript_1366/g.5565  ORF Transcript_1366/g.5565 Transcript_1366/m.5565 type:complete len:322 (-) Transcript_1366:31-996(-)